MCKQENEKGSVYHAPENLVGKKPRQVEMLKQNKRKFYRISGIKPVLDMVLIIY